MQEPEILSITRGTWRMEDAGVRSFLFAGSEIALLIDSGKTISNMKDIAQRLTSKPLMLVNTHADFDHIASNPQFEAAYMHPAEYPHYFKVQNRRGSVRPLWDGVQIDIGGRSFEVIATPGHTPGSISLLDRQDRILIGGDGIQDGQIYLYGPHRSLTAYLYSLKRLADRIDEFDTVYPSHGSFPMPSSQITRLIEGVEKMMAGRIQGIPADSFGTPIKVYGIGPAKILYDVHITF